MLLYYSIIVLQCHSFISVSSLNHELLLAIFSNTDNEVMSVLIGQCVYGQPLNVHVFSFQVLCLIWT